MVKQTDRWVMDINCTVAMVGGERENNIKKYSNHKTESKSQLLVPSGSASRRYKFGFILC